MKLGELFIELGVVGDTKELSKALKQMKKAENITKARQKIEKQLGRSLKANEVNVIKNAFALGDMVKSTMKVATAIGGTVLALDRMAQSMIRVNQSFIGFQAQTGLSISKANKFVSALGLIAGTSKEGVLSDLTTMSQRLFQLGQFGEGSAIFAQMGFSPRGLKPDELIGKIRDVAKTKGYSEETLTYITDQLGLSRDWVQLLQMEDDFFNKVMSDSKDLQLSEEKRLELYKLGYENRLAHAKIEKEILELQIKLLPIVNALETLFANIIQNISKFPTGFVEIIGIISGILATLKPVQKAFVNIYKIIAKIPIIGKSILPFVRILGLAGSRLLPIIGQLMLVWDIVKGIFELLNGEPKGWFAKLMSWIGGKVGKIFQDPNENTSNLPEPVNTQTQLRNTNNNISSNMTNNFYNNPVPAGEVQNQLSIIRDQNLGWV